MKHLLTVVLIGALCLSLCACAETDSPDPTIPAPETIPETVAVLATLPPETLPPESVTVYEGAVVDYLLPLENFSYVREASPQFVMIHFTSNVMANRENPYDIQDLRAIFVDYEVSIHYIIDREGIIRCYIPEDRVAWHAGKGEWAGNPALTDRMNYHSIGIELAAIGSQSDMSIYMSAAEYAALDSSLIGFTDAQYASLSLLVADICSRYHIPMDRNHIIGHEEYASRKRDPGELFDWSRIVPDSVG